MKLENMDWMSSAPLLSLAAGADADPDPASPLSDLVPIEEDIKLLLLWAPRMLGVLTSKLLDPPPSSEVSSKSWL